ncbi:MAG: hypothetical protein M3041_13650 [Acidobacteriota bacterium]|nr:hypothetical protein [Acidobacteriota bacterium]
MDLRVPRAAQALVIMLHGAGASKDWGFFPWVAEILCDAGVAVCRFTMSRPEDLTGVVRHCQTRVALPTFLFGHAEGADVPMHVPNLRGVVVWSAARAPNVSVPLLLINSAETDAPDVSRVRIVGADRNFSERRDLILAADVTARFICAYS